MSKQHHYQVLITKMKAAYAANYYLEAAWLAYGILEDRLISALRQSGGIPLVKKKPIRMLGPKIGELNKRRVKDKLLAAYFTDDLMTRINDWKVQRDNLMHSMADEAVPIVDIEKDAYLLAQRGLTLVNLSCTAARNLKSNRDHVAVPP